MSRPLSYCMRVLCDEGWTSASGRRQAVQRRRAMSTNLGPWRAQGWVRGTALRSYALAARCPIQSLRIPSRWSLIDAWTLKLTRLCRIRLVRILNLRGCSWRADLALVRVPCSSREHHPLQASLQSSSLRFYRRRAYSSGRLVCLLQQSKAGRMSSTVTASTTADRRVFRPQALGLGP